MLGILVFDLDGTLIDSMADHAAAFGDVLARLGIERQAAMSYYIATAGRPLNNQFEGMLETAGLKPDPVRLLLDEFWDRVTQIDATPFPEVPDSLEALAEAGYRIAVISGCTQRLVDEKLRRSGLERFVEAKLGSDDSEHGVRKGPGLLALAEHELGERAGALHEHGMVIGDAAFDVEIAVAAGIRSIGRGAGAQVDILWEAGADMVVEDLNGVVRHLTPDGDGFVTVNSLPRRHG